MKPLQTRLAAFLTAVMLLLAGPALAVKAPEKAIGEDTMLVVWLDVEQISPKLIKQLGDGLGEVLDNPMLADQGIGLPLGDTKEMVQGITAFRDGFVKAGGKGLLLTMAMPGEDDDAWSPPLSVLANSGDKPMDRAAMKKLFDTVSEGEVDAEFAPIGGGWHDVSMVADGGEAVTLPLPKPDAEANKAFNKQLGAAKKPMLSIAFRMQDELREMMDENLQGLGGEGNPELAMMMGMIQPIKSLDTLGINVSMVGEEDFKVDVQMDFLDEQQALMFMNMYNSIMMLAPAMLAQQVQGVPDAPNPNELNQFFMKLMMKADGKTLSLTLDPAFFEMAEKLGPLMQGEADLIR